MAIGLSKCSNLTLNSVLKIKADYRPVLTYNSRYNLNEKVHLREKQTYFLCRTASPQKHQDLCFITNSQKYSKISVLISLPSPKYFRAIYQYSY